MDETPAVQARNVDPAAEGGAGHRADYADAYAVPVTAPLSAEQWVRAVFEGAPRPVRWLLVVGWRVVLGLRLGPRPSADHVLGWRIVDRAPTRIELGLSSTATTARLVLVTGDADVVLTTLVQHDRRRGRVLWTALGPIHRRMVPYLMTRAARENS